MPERKTAALPVDVPVDTVLQFQVIGRLLADRTMQSLWEAGFDDLRESDGYVFQHLVPGPIAVTELASRLGVTQQAASKTVADLEARAYVTRVAAPDDARYRLVTLSERGKRVITTTRSIRTTLAKKLVKSVDDAEGFARTLRDITESLGGSDVLTNRRLVSPR